MAALGAGEGRPPRVPPTGPAAPPALPASAELAGLSFPGFQMTAAPVGSSFWSWAGEVSSGRGQCFKEEGETIGPRKTWLVAAARGVSPVCRRGALVKFRCVLRKRETCRIKVPQHKISALSKSFPARIALLGYSNHEEKSFGSILSSCRGVEQ